MDHSTTAKNVFLNKKDIVCARELLEWVNKTLQCEIRGVDELRTGAVYCQLMHCLFPLIVPLQKVHLFSHLEFEFMKNFKILQAIFDRLKVNKIIPVSDLIAARGNQEFLQWFYKFFHANATDSKYDALEERNKSPIGLDVSNKWRVCLRSMSLGSVPPLSRAKNNDSIAVTKRTQGRIHCGDSDDLEAEQHAKLLNDIPVPRARMKRRNARERETAKHMPKEQPLHVSAPIHQELLQQMPKRESKPSPAAVAARAQPQVAQTKRKALPSAASMEPNSAHISELLDMQHSRSILRDPHARSSSSGCRV